MEQNNEIDKAVKALADAAATIDKHDVLFLVTVKDDDNEDSNVNICGFTSNRMAPLELMGLSKLFDKFLNDYIENIREKSDMSEILDELKRQLLDRKKEEEDDEF